MNNPANEADYIPVSTPTPFMSVSPIRFLVPGRQTDLQLKISAPISGAKLPILLLSHGHGPSIYLSSQRGYSPLAEFYAAHGFVVIQPTHQDSKALGLDPTGPEGPLFWRSRAQDLRFIIDHLREVLGSMPGLNERVDHQAIVAVGHSLGGQTVGLLAGMRVTDPVDGKRWDLSDPRVRAGVLLAPPGHGADLAAWALEHYPALGNNSFAEMTTQALVVAGDEDYTELFSKRKDWRFDAYVQSPEPKACLTMYGAKHSLGGVSGYDVAESQDQDPERLGVIQRVSWAYLRTALDARDPAWHDAISALHSQPKPLGKVEEK